MVDMTSMHACIRDGTWTTQVLDRISAQQRFVQSRYNQWLSSGAANAWLRGAYGRYGKNTTVRAMCTNRAVHGPVSLAAFRRVME